MHACTGSVLYTCGKDTEIQDYLHFCYGEKGMGEERPLDGKLVVGSTDGSTGREQGSLVSKQLRDAVLATMQGHVLTRMQADFDFLTDQRVVVLHALGFPGR